MAPSFNLKWLPTPIPCITTLLAYLWKEMTMKTTTMNGTTANSMMKTTAKKTMTAVTVAAAASTLMRTT
ncbi:hypothetical protein PILCRDRAFT_376416 [Piloderma croceum F 1598]|uniref:Uncharacterized protein n=1 Tax=Piloderma croceum (strain F 1598) TaxID=765440 RepID=A0A0C3BF59_PILCF|nr:hypothetical protein PILCRDRAFT_376416 [Piloderma croceum F 1598]